MKEIVFLLVCALTYNLISFGSEIEEGSNIILTDVDGNKYKTVKIGTQIWMAENLRTTKYNDGTPIPQVKDKIKWDSLASNSMAYCWYDNDSLSYANIYGALYTWAAAINITSNDQINTIKTKRICPNGWHVPEKTEWEQLKDYLGGEFVAGGKLKEANTAHWISPNIGATNETGFTALPGGCRNTNGKFSHLGYNGRWWTSDAFSASIAYLQILQRNNSGINNYANSKTQGLSIRCVKD